MADNIVQGLFGLSPYDVQQARLQDTNTQALQYAKLDPFQKANMSLYQAGSGLGRIGAGMLGMVDPKEQEAQIAEMGQAQIDHSTPEGLLKGAEMFNQVGNPKMAMMYAQAAQAMKEKQSKLDLEAAHAKYYAQGGAKGSTVKNLLAQFAPAMARIRNQAMINGIGANLKGKELSDYVESQVQLGRNQYINDVNVANQSQIPDANGIITPPVNIDWSQYDNTTPEFAMLPTSKSDVAGATKAAEEGERYVDSVGADGITRRVKLKDLNKDTDTSPQFNPKLQGDIEGYKKVAGKVGEENVANYDRAIKSSTDLPKINKLINLLETSSAPVGFGAEFFKNINRIRAFLGSEEGKKLASDSEKMDAYMGAEIFPLIQSLGIGARGMDTPAERDFMRSVLTGTTSLNKETLLELARIRKNASEGIIKNINEQTSSGELDNFYKASGKRKKLITFDDPSLVDPQTGRSKIDASTPEKRALIMSDIAKLRKIDPNAADILLNNFKQEMKIARPNRDGKGRPPTQAEAKALLLKMKNEGK